jgi:hypothetical protein
MERGQIEQTTGRISGAGPRRSALHFLAEIRVTSRGKQVEFYWAGVAPAGEAGQHGRVWRTVHSAALGRADSASLAEM